MTTYVLVNGELVEKSQVQRDESGSAPYVISDTMEMTRHMADGKHYSSKSQFRKATRAAGCYEVGNETKAILTPRKPITLDRGRRVEDIKRAIYQLRNRSK